MITAADLQPVIVAAIFLVSSVLIALGIAIRGVVNLKTQYDALHIRTVTLEVDEEEREKKIAARWQELIQLTFTEQAKDIRELRDKIDNANTEIGIQKTLNAQKDEKIAEFERNQHSNMQKITMLNEQIDLFHVAASERDLLKQQVDRLTIQVQEFEQRSQERHNRINEITAKNFELNDSLRNMTTERDQLRQQLVECELRIKDFEIQALGAYYFSQQNPNYFTGQYFTDRQPIIVSEPTNLLP